MGSGKINCIINRKHAWVAIMFFLLKSSGIMPSINNIYSYSLSVVSDVSQPMQHSQPFVVHNIQLHIKVYWVYYDQIEP